jgi:hypothetical protein
MSDQSAVQGPAPQTDRWAPVAYFVVGQVGWFACVLSAARGVPWIGVSITVVFLGMHLLRAAHPLEEFKLLTSVMVIGGIWESTLVYFGLLSYPSGTVVEGLAPYWLLALWALFAAQINTTYQWLKSRIPAAALMGAVAGPISFRAGAALKALNLERSWVSVAALAVGWAILLPVVILLSRRWDGLPANVPTKAIAE